MKLSKDLVSQFVKATNDKTYTKSEKTLYGTVSGIDTNSVITQIILDGGNLSNKTPVITTVQGQNGDRITATIKDHEVIVNGNLSQPAVNNRTTDTIKDDLSVTNNNLSTVENKVQTISDEGSSYFANAFGDYVNREGSIMWECGSEPCFVLDTDTITTSQSLYNQFSGFVFVFSEYSGTTVLNNSFNMFYIPKTATEYMSGASFVFTMFTEDLSYAASKIVYISDDTGSVFTGNSNNNQEITSNTGIKFNNNHFVLRYILAI